MNYSTCSAALTLLDDGDEDDCVGDDDDEQGQQVDHHDPEDGVRSLPGRTGERVEGDALGVPLELRVFFHVENVNLKFAVECYNRFLEMLNGFSKS